MTSIEDLEVLVSAVEEARADLAPTYSEYVRVAFAIANEFGEAGRSYFHRICTLYTNGYDAAACERMYNSALKDQRGGITFGTLMYLARQAGVEVKKRDEKVQSAKVQSTSSSHEHERGRVYNRCDDGDGEELVMSNDPSIALPVFAPHAWPWPLNICVDAGETPQQRDIMLLGAMTVTGACLSLSLSVLYGRMLHYPCLQCFIVAPPASGKGIVSHLKMLATPVHDELRQRSRDEFKEYTAKQQQWMQLGKEKQTVPPPERPVNRMFLIPGNNTGTGILQNIIDNDGRGLIFESEADTVSTAIGTDFGHWSDTLRKAFDHDGLSYNRRTGNEFREVKHSRLSVLLSGTPAQVAPLIPSAENGLFSRQLFYYMPTLHEWRNQFGDWSTDLHDNFEALGKTWKQHLDRIISMGAYRLVLTSSQQHDFNLLFERLYRHSQDMNGDEMNSSMVRLAINIMRMMSITALLRAFEHGKPLVTPSRQTSPDNIEDGIVALWEVSITDDDFAAVLSLAEPLYKHTLHVLSFLQSTDVKRRSHADRDALFALLPDTFTREELMQKGDEMMISQNTVASWLLRWRRAGAVKNADKRGVYIITRPRSRL